jgi:hypothetical protein
MVCHRVQPGTPAISYKLITTITHCRITLLPYCRTAVLTLGSVSVTA